MKQIIHKIYTGVDMRARWYRSACGLWNKISMIGSYSWKSVNCKNCLKTREQ